MPIIDFSDSFLRIYFTHLSINLEKEDMPSLRFYSTDRLITREKKIFLFSK